jgi:hypothetical protein
MNSRRSGFIERGVVRPLSLNFIGFCSNRSRQRFLHAPDEAAIELEFGTIVGHGMHVTRVWDCYSLFSGGAEVSVGPLEDRRGLRHSSRSCEGQSWPPRPEFGHKWPNWSSRFLLHVRSKRKACEARRLPCIEGAELGDFDEHSKGGGRGRDARQDHEPLGAISIGLKLFEAPASIAAIRCSIYAPGESHTVQLLGSWGDFTR